MKYSVVETYPSPIYISGGLLCDISGRASGITPDYFCGLFTFEPRVTREEPTELTNSLLWYHRDGAGWRKTVVAENYAVQVGKAAADITGSGTLDIVFGEWDNRVITGLSRPGGNIYWAEQPADPFRGNWPVHRITSGCNNPHDILAGDLDGDGRAEVIVRNKDGKLSVYKNAEDPRELWAEYPVCSYVRGDGTALWDVTGSGYPDIVTAEGFFENKDGSLKNWKFHSFGMERYGMDGETRIAVGRLDGERLTMVVTESELSDGARIMLFTTGDGGMTWEAATLVGRERNFHALHTLRLHDVDGSGLPDIFTAEMENGKTDGLTSKPRWFLFRNRGGLQFEEEPLLDENLGAHLGCIGPISTSDETEILANVWKSNAINGCDRKNHLLHMKL